MSTLFTMTALIGGTVLVFQFLLMLMGLGHGSGELASGDVADVANGAAAAGGESGAVTAGDQPTWHEAADADLGHPEAPWFYEALSLRTLSAAATFFGLAGKTALAYDYSPFASLVLAILAGIAAMYFVYWLFKQVYKLQHSGSENIRNAIGASAAVYVPIPGKRAGAGKVTFKLQNRLVEYQAITDDEQRLITGEKVIVVAVINSDTVRVTRAPAAVPEGVSCA